MQDTREQGRRISSGWAPEMASDTLWAKAPKRSKMWRQRRARRAGRSGRHGCPAAMNAPCARKRRAWLEPDQGVSSPKCVRRTSHGLDGKAAPPDVGKAVTSEEHQVGVALIDPERDLPSVIRITQLDASQAILVPLEVAERVIEHCRANLFRTLEIEFRAAYRLRADRKAALVRP
jgi:hypothetical protein